VLEVYNLKEMGKDITQRGLKIIKVQSKKIELLEFVLKQKGVMNNRFGKLQKDNPSINNKIRSKYLADLKI